MKNILDTILTLLVMLAAMAINDNNLDLILKIIGE